MGEDTFNSLCAPVKRVSLNVLSLNHLSLLAERRAWTHLREIVQQQLQITELHFISNQATAVTATNKFRGGAEKFESDLRTFSE